VTSNWLRDGQRLSVQNAPTRFGPVSYEIISHTARGFIEARIEPPTWQKPEQIFLRLRHPDGKRIQSMLVNGRRYRAFDPSGATIRIQPTTSSITVRAQF